MSLCIEKVAAMECEYTNDVARCDIDMNDTCQLDANVGLVLSIFGSVTTFLGAVSRRMPGT